MHLPEPQIPAWQKPQMFYGKELRFNPNNHRYYWDDKPVPSVTTIINRLSKPLLIQWAADMAVEHIRKVKSFDELTLSEARTAHNRIKEEAGDIGNTVHNVARALIGGQPKPATGSMTLEGANALAALEKWVAAHKIEPLGIERRVMSAKQLYAGTVDFVGRIDGRLGVLDFKTGNGVYDEAWWQTCGYVDALAEEEVLPPGVPVLRWIVHLSKKDGSFAVHERGLDDHYDYDVWRALVAADKALRMARKHPQPKRARAA